MVVYVPFPDRRAYMTSRHRALDPRPFTRRDARGIRSTRRDAFASNTRAAPARVTRTALRANARYSAPRREAVGRAPPACRFAA